MMLNTILREAEALQQAREDENTWSKINDVLLKLTEIVRTKDEARTVLNSSNELVVRSIQSDRSKLAGTALNFVKSCILILGSEFTAVALYLTSLVKVCGKSNRIFYSRGEDVLVVLCRNINIRLHFRFFNEYSSSVSKNVRLAIFKGIEAAFGEGDKLEEFENIVIRGRNDPFPDVREICRRMIAGFGIDAGKTDGNGILGRASRERFNNSEVKSEPIRVVRQPVRPNFVPNKSIIQQAMMGKKDLASRFSPMRKQTKIDSKDCDKIRELERQIKDITEEIKPTVNIEGDYKAVSKHEPIRTRIRSLASETGKARNSAIHPEDIFNVRDKLVNQDDLTPVRLDRYLNKYRKEYGEATFKRESIAVCREDGETKEVDEVQEMDMKKDKQMEEDKSLGTVECINLYEDASGDGGSGRISMTDELPSGNNISEGREALDQDTEFGVVDKEMEGSKELGNHIEEHMAEMDSSISETQSEFSLVDGEEPAMDSVVGELSKNLANFSITEPGLNSFNSSMQIPNDGVYKMKPEFVGNDSKDECSGPDEFIELSASVSPYENLESRNAMEQTLKYEYTIVNSGDEEANGLDFCEGKQCKSQDQGSDVIECCLELGDAVLPDGHEDAAIGQRSAEGDSRDFGADVDGHSVKQEKVFGNDHPVFDPAQNSSIHESTIIIDSPLKKNDDANRSGSEMKRDRKESFGMTGNRFMGLLYLSESSGEETVFSNPSGKKSGACEKDIFANEPTQKVENKAMSRVSKENPEQAPSLCSPDRSNITKNKVSSSFLYESINSLAVFKPKAGADEDDGEFSRVSMGSTNVDSGKCAGDCEDDEDDFTVVDSFVQVKRNAFRKNRMSK